MPGPSYRFGPYFVDRGGYRVMRGDQVVELTPKLIDLLLHLVDHRGMLVTKEELLDALWPGANVTDNALAQAVSELRQLLGDEAGAPKFIKTVARRGYRFIASVEEIDDRAAGPVDTPHFAGKDEPQNRNSIAVMDFVNLSGNQVYGWLSAGIAETVTGDLRALGAFRVVDRWRVMEAAQRTDGSLKAVTSAVGAGLAVVGSFQPSADRIRINARVVDAPSGEALADAKVDGPTEGIFDLQDQVVMQFARDLGIASEKRPSSVVGVRETPSLEAFRAFTEGSLRLESLNLDDMERAIDDFERAVSLDSRYAAAYTGLANAEFAQYETTRSDNVPARPLLDRAIAHARHAIELDEGLAEAHATLALALVSDWKTSEALTAAQRAVTLEPSNWRHLFRLGHASWGDARLQAADRMLAMYPEFAFTHFQMAMVHVARGHLGQAENVLRRGAAVQEQQSGRAERFPALGLHWLLGLTRLAQGNIPDALAEFERELLLAEPKRLYGREFAMNAHHGRGLSLIAAERFPDACEAFGLALDLYPDHGPSHLGLAHAASRLHDDRVATAARAHVDQAISTLARSRPIEAAILRAKALVADGSADAAIQTLDRLLTDAPPGFAAWTLPIEPFLSQLKAHQGFAAMLRRLAERAE
ncbi:MAG TPA: winged helix-turn-helix domain-containing protein [Vicinamibacterales bacterium]|jgi:DNA-binding winged helix-turn-helix (wHTH) protein/tetratricopeptide (TPR) repeat protein